MSGTVTVLQGKSPGSIMPPGGSSGDDLLRAGGKLGGETLPVSLRFARGSKRFTIRQSELLRSIGFQEHHIAPKGFAKGHELWELADTSIESRVNKIFLPNAAELSQRSVHNGRHANSYGRNIVRQMDSIVERGRTAGWTTEQYRTALRDLLADAWRDLRTGRVSLYR
jgi:hypothetical protein